MFTGLVEEVGTITRLTKNGAGGRLTVRAHAVLEGTKLGDSIAVSGACLTVVALGTDTFTVDCMPETLLQTTLGGAVAGRPVNLERALAVGSRLGGHMVLGHVDAVAETVAVRQRGASREIRFSLPNHVAVYVAPKGSVAIDGISLTIMRVGDGWFEIGVIPHTLEETTLRAVEAGQLVNLEADVLARYVQRALEKGYVGAVDEAAGGGLTEELLRNKGFI